MSEEKKKERKKKRRRLSDDEKEKLRRKALLLKAAQFKRVTDAAIFVCLLLVIAGAFLPLIYVKAEGGELRVTGLQAVVGRESKTGRHGLLKCFGADGTVYARLTAGGEIARGSGRTVRPYKVPWYGYAFVGVYPLAALFFLLYLLDFVVPVGRPLPVASAVYGVFTLGYMLAMVMFGGPFNEFKSYSLLSLLLGSFALAFASLLRLPNSARKRRRMLRAAKKGEPLEPFFAPPEEKEEAPPAEAEKEKAEAEPEGKGLASEAEEEGEAEPKQEEARPAEAEASEAPADPEPEAAGAPGSEGGEAPPEEGPEGAPEGGDEEQGAEKE